MKNSGISIFVFLLIGITLFSTCVGLLVRFNKSNDTVVNNTSISHEHIDSNNDGKCDSCGENLDSVIIPPSPGFYYSGFKRVDSLPPATKEEYDKNLLYQQGGDIAYLVSETQPPKMNSFIADLVVNSSYKGNAVYDEERYIYLIGYTSLKNNDIVKFDTNNYTSEILTLQFPTSSILNFKNAQVVYSKKYKVFYFASYSDDFTKSQLFRWDGDITHSVEYVQGSDMSNKSSGCVVYDDTIYILTRDVIRKFDIPTSTFKESATVSGCTDAINGNTMCFVNNSIYMFGLYKSSKINAYMHKLDLSTNTVQQTKVALWPDGNNGFGIAPIKDKIYIFSGYNDTESASYSDLIRVVDLANETISTSELKLPEAVNKVIACTANDNIFIFGGTNASGGHKKINMLSFGEVIKYKKLTGV